MVEIRYIGWISLIEIPKVGSRWKDQDHVDIDELWIEPNFRGKGFAKAVMKKADDLKTDLQAGGDYIWKWITRQLKHYINIVEI